MPPVVDLPAGSRCRSAELRPLTGRDEEWLALLPPGTPTALAVTGLLGRCVERLDPASAGADGARALLAGDRDFLLLALRRLSFGSWVEATAACPACSARLDVAFDIDDVSVEPGTPGEGAVEVPGTDGQLHSVGCHPPTGADQEAAALAGPEAALDVLLERCVDTVDGRAAGPAERALLGAAALERLDEALARCGVRVELGIDLACPECGSVTALDVDPAAFLLADMRTAGAQLVREVHVLASTYHWSEAEILGLSRHRRHDYLALVARDRSPAGV